MYKQIEIKSISYQFKIFSVVFAHFNYTVWSRENNVMISYSGMYHLIGVVFKAV